MYLEKIPIQREEINLNDTLFCGQAFRWKSNQDNTYETVLHRARILVATHQEYLCVKSTKKRIKNQSLRNFFQDYFRIGLGFEDLFHDDFQKKYHALFHKIKKYYGLKTLKQDPFESMISFMCAQGLGIVRVRDQVQNLCFFFGEQVAENCYDFPDPYSLATAKFSLLVRATNNNTIRAKNIQKVARDVLEKKISIDELSQQSYSNVKHRLVSLDGIGDKIADCICLFGFGFLQAVPIDRHVKAFLESWFGCQELSFTRKNYQRLEKKAQRILGEKAGPAHQILFHYWRIDKKGLTAQ